MNNIIKGIIIGIGKIIPGISGSVIAISLGVYEKAIFAINNFYKDKKYMFYLIKLLLGILISIIFVSKLLVFLLNNYYSVTILIFIGFILGNMKEINQNVRKNYFYLTIIAFSVISVLSFISIDNSFKTNNELVNFIFYFFAGIVDAFSTIIPGISGTALLMLMGAYNNIILLFSNLLNFNTLFSNIKIVIPFFIGMLFGLFLSIKLISFLFKHYYYQTYNIILGLLLGSVLLMLKSCINSFTSLVLGIIIISISYIIIKKINHFFG